MELKFILESLLFAAEKPMSARELRECLAKASEHSEEPAAKGFKKTREEELISALEQLEKDYASAGRSFRLVCVAGAWQFASQPEYSPWLKALVGEKARPPRLSLPALETLAIIAYRQPLTRVEMEQIRGVSVDGVLQTLVERRLVEQVGRAEVAGRPMNYGTTPAFLEYFGLRSLEDLPAADELRRIPVTRPESLLTVEPGLATMPPEQLSLVPSGHDAAAQSPSSSAADAGEPNQSETPPGGTGN